MTGRAALLAGWGAAIAATLGAGPDQSAGGRYRSAHLRCAGFAETVRTRIRGESGGATVADQAGRDGLLVVRARDSIDGLAIEAWYDSLAVWRATDTGRESPDVEGFLGGRYRGWLSLTGEYRGRAVPFVPEEVGDVADLSPVMKEFFPLLPPIDLAVGREWRDPTGLEIRRVADQRDVTGRETIRRYQWNGVRRVADRTEVTDSLAVTVDQLIRERGELQWSMAMGPLSWTRHLVITARIPARGGVRQTVTSMIEQDVTVVRRFDLEGCRR